MNTTIANPLKTPPLSGFGYIYKITDPNGKSYIGQTCKSVLNRFNRHCYSNTPCKALKHSIQSFGAASMKIEILGTFPVASLDIEEYNAIRSQQTLFPFGLNLKPNPNWCGVKEVVALWKKTLTSLELKELYSVQKKCKKTKRVYNTKHPTPSERIRLLMKDQIFSNPYNKFMGLPFDCSDP